MNFEMHISKRLLLGLGLATLIMESVVIQPAFAADKALHKIGLIATDSLRVEPYATPLKVLPIDETKK
jgi:hypothetical protein